MKKFNFNLIEKKHKKLIDKSKLLMEKIESDYMHNHFHIEDVVSFTKILLENINENFDAEVCLISAYWHDVGRINKNEGHEQESCVLLKEEMKSLLYDENFIEKCKDAICFHGIRMSPKTIEGKIIQDADFLAMLGERRWNECKEHDVSMTHIVDMLDVAFEKLNFDYSKNLFLKTRKIIEEKYK